MQLELQNICYSYNGKDPILKDVSYTFQDGSIYAIIGKSGAGKTTLLSLLSQLCKPTKGTIVFNQQDITTIDPYEYRSHYVGVIFQSYNLLMHLTALENVMLSMEIAGVHKERRKAEAMELLKRVGLEEEEANRRILKLSGGQQQRVAIARALSYDAPMILADEPTGNLDEETQDEIMAIFKKLAYEDGKCIIIVTHSPSVAQEADEIYELQRLGKRKKTQNLKRVHEKKREAMDL